MAEPETEWDARRQLSKLASELDGEARQLGLPRSTLVSLLDRLYARGVLTFEAAAPSTVPGDDVVRAIEAAGLRVVRR